MQVITTKPLSCHGMDTWQYGNSLINYMKLVRILIEKLGDQCKVVFAFFVTDITSGWNFKELLRNKTQVLLRLS
jgi:hypothetical protein